MNGSIQSAPVTGVPRRKLLMLAASTPLLGLPAKAQTQRPPADTPQAGFAAVDAALERRIRRGELAGVSYAVMRDGKPLTSRFLGQADREAGVPLREDHLFRAFSNTKLAVSCAALQMVEQGRFGLEDPVANYIPAMRDMRVLRLGSKDLADLVPADRPVTVRHLLTHTAGLTYSFLRPQAPLSRLYAQSGMMDPTLSLSGFMDVAARMPLMFQPGTDWDYSMGTDVIGRLLEVVAGKPLDVVLKHSIFEPLGMHDTVFFVPPEKQSRLAAMYAADPTDGSGDSLRRADQLPYPGANLKVVPRLFPGGGLVTSLPDWMKLLGALSTGGAPILKGDTLPLVFDNQLPADLWIKSLFGGQRIPGRGHSMVGSVTTGALPAGWIGSPGDVEWGGLAGTHWLISPRDKLACAVMTQRFMAFEAPFWMEFKQLMRAAIAA